jgi:hypothetical protein
MAAGCTKFLKQAELHGLAYAPRGKPLAANAVSVNLGPFQY